MNEIITPAMIEKRLRELSKEIDQAHQNMVDLELDYHQTKSKYEFLTYAYNQKNNDEKELKKLIEKWININGLVYGDYIFGKTSLSKMVGDMNKMLGYDEHKAINLFRHIRVTEEHGKNLSFEKRSKLAEKMGHSIFTSKKYKRNIQIMEIED